MGLRETPLSSQRLRVQKPPNHFIYQLEDLQEAFWQNSMPFQRLFDVIIAVLVTQSRSICSTAAFNQTGKSLSYCYRGSMSLGKFSLPTPLSSRTPSSVPKILCPSTSKLSVESDPKINSLQWQELGLTCSPHFLVPFPLLLIEHAVY